MCSHVGTKGAGCEAIRRPCCLLMIRFVLVQNRQGKVRLAKYYVRMVEAEKAQIPGEVFRVIAPRDQRSQSNFVEVRKRSRDADISVGVGERCLNALADMSSSATTTKSCIGAMQACIFVRASTRTTTNWLA